MSSYLCFSHLKEHQYAAKKSERKTIHVTSTKAMSDKDLFELLSAVLIAGHGPIPIILGSTPETP